MLALRSAAMRVSATFTLVVFSTDMNMPITITASGRPHLRSGGGALGCGGVERDAVFAGASLRVEAVMVSRLGDQIPNNRSPSHLTDVR
ncbi:hypothetical protein GCM10023320_81990 [Pseudonocardia adelaidensis]|uniref:Secreted protein n=1 Tax=Pseudonocardia adelaidensis TaxID=648754 RepID=A0ABP9PCG6_9PSEU